MCVTVFGGKIRRHAGSLFTLAATLVTAELVPAADWPMRGRDHTRNPVVADEEGPVDWQIAEPGRAAKNIRWSAPLGTVSCGTPVIANGLVWVGTNNGRPRDPDQAQDASVLMCFRESDGVFLDQYATLRVPPDRRIDWPSSSHASSPLIEGERMWFCTTQGEVVCLDIGPLLAQTGKSRVVWKIDMRAQFGVVPRPVMIGSPISQCSVAGYKDLIYVNTTNARGHDRIPAPSAPSLLCLQKEDGRVRWQDNSPGEKLLDVQHGNPLVAEIEGQPQVILGQGDGWLRSFHALTGEVLWKFDINRKSAKWRRQGAGKSDLVAMPVCFENRVYFTIGRHYEIGTGQGRICCLDPTRRGDISSELEDGLENGRANPNSGVVWEYFGRGEKVVERMNRTLSCVAIHDGLLIAPDLDGLVHCLDARTGEWFWSDDTLGFIMSDPLIVGSTVYVANDDGSVFLWKLSRKLERLGQREFNDSIEAGPVFANGSLYVTTRRNLIAVSDRPVIP